MITSNEYETATVLPQIGFVSYKLNNYYKNISYFKIYVNIFKL